MIMHYNKLPILGVYHATFPIQKGPGASSLNCKKKIPGIIPQKVAFSRRVRSMVESSKLPKSWTLEIQILKLAGFVTKLNNFKFKWLFVFRLSEN